MELYGMESLIKESILFKAIILNGGQGRSTKEEKWCWMILMGAHMKKSKKIKPGCHDEGWGMLRVIFSFPSESAELLTGSFSRTNHRICEYIRLKWQIPAHMKSKQTHENS